MRVAELAKMAARRGVISHLNRRGCVKNASIIEEAARNAGPLTVGALLPAAALRAHNRADSVEAALNAAGLNKLSAEQMPDIGSGAWWRKGLPTGGGIIGGMAMPLIQAPAAGLAERLKGVFGVHKEEPGMMDTLKTDIMKGLGKGVADAGVSLMKDMAAKAVSAVGSIGQQAARDAILKSLKREDPILAEQSDKTLMEAYHTMVRFAPTLSTDKNAVRSFLRQAVMSGTGPDYASIKLLADTERAVTGRS